MSFPAVSALLFIILIMEVEFIQSIHHGDKVQLGDEYEHHVLLWNYVDVENPCGGSIIDQWHVLTAAHCVHKHLKHDLYVTAGIIRLKDLPAAITRKVLKIHMPNDWNFEFMDPTGTGDIALLTLETPLKLSSRVRAIRLPQNGVIDFNKHHDFYGWGRMYDESPAPPSYMSKMKFKTLPITDCKKRSAPHSQKGSCAISPNEDATVLGGDSGGGLILEDTIVGVLSNSAEDPEVPTRFTKVFSYLEFINAKINEDGEFPSRCARPPPSPFRYPFRCSTTPSTCSSSSSASESEGDD